MTCRDNGRGFDPAALDEWSLGTPWDGGARRKHRRKLLVHERPGKGTEVQVVVPSRRAYVRSGGFRQVFSRGSGA
jgi:hypothetical protein